MSKESQTIGSSSNNTVAAPHEGLKPLNYKEQFAGRHSESQFIDPCAEASKASLACLNRNNYDRESCQDYFQAYRTCKQTWTDQRKADRKKGTS